MDNGLILPGFNHFVSERNREAITFGCFVHLGLSLGFGDNERGSHFAERREGVSLREFRREVGVDSDRVELDLSIRGGLGHLNKAPDDIDLEKITEKDEKLIKINMIQYCSVGFIV